MGVGRDDPPGPGPAAVPDDPGLLRGVGRWSLVALMINAIVGAGIFGLPSKVHALAGPFGLLAYAACAAVIAVIALSLAEVSSRFAATGGPYLYAERAFGPLPGFLIGWLMWVTRATALAAIGAVMASYLSFFWAPAAAGWGRSAALALALSALAAINVGGVRRAAAAANAFAIAKLVPLLLFVGVGVLFLDRSAFAGAAMPDAASFSRATLQLIFAFVGFEVVVVAAGEAKDPRRDMPFALAVAIPAATLLYVLIQTVCIGTLPALGASERPLADASARFAGPWGGSIVAAGALVSTAGTLFVSLLVGPRVLYAMSARGQLPPWFGRTHARFRTPHVAILVTAAAGLALAVTGTFTHLLSLSVLARLTAYLIIAGALIVFRRRDRRPESDPARETQAAFRAPAGPAVAALTAAACAWLLTASGARELRDIGLALAAGLALYALAGRRRASRGGVG